ncbi:hypothetical protein GCM10027285_26810 [Oleiagrimonas citrea]|uniref:Flagellar hook-basal body complex protein FliE n=1 Tax=Oleiagrimonas citrea TaxID=1665687 RepID=A0A846ZNI3_9GAMM|nr:flagellar hook-basal body complex protein FliE [Oleiagrimonas citrea]NKZ39021.1 flagellar hook-basal body complex protein FliE [Oleiagrimonas citrea]
MMIDAVNAVGGAGALSVERTTSAASPEVGFDKMLGDGLHSLNTKINASDEVLRAMAAGKDIPVHEAMMVMEQAQMSLQFAVQVRNRLVSAYQQIMQMQI